MTSVTSLYDALLKGMILNTVFKKDDNRKPTYVIGYCSDEFFFSHVIRRHNNASLATARWKVSANKEIRSNEKTRLGHTLA